MTSVRQTDRVLVCFAVRDEARHFNPPSTDHRTLITGIGPKNARQQLTQALDTAQPSLVLTCGYAGGLNPELKLGTLIYDAGSNLELAGQLDALGARRAVFHCADRIAVTAAEKAALRDQTRADAVEMESGVIRGICTQRGIPAATVRVISDDARSDLPLDFNQLAKPDGNISYLRLALKLAGSPGCIGRLLRFQRELTECSRNLGRLLEALLRRHSG
jgi:adenosylhomocysteine nucleosidase